MIKVTPCHQEITSLQISSCPAKSETYAMSLKFTLKYGSILKQLYV